MAKSKAKDEPESARTGTNGFDRGVLMQFVKDIEGFEEQMASKQGEYMAFCRGKRELINQTLDRAAAAGVPKKELRAVLRVRKLEQKAKDIREGLEEADAIDTFDLIRDAIGPLADTPLGRAALGEKEWEDADPKKAERQARADADAAALNAAADVPHDNGASRLADLKTLN